MPRIVDHEERRRAVAEVAARLVAQGGLDAVTVRDVAAAAGTSTTIVSHYFSDKRDLLRATYAQAAAQARARVEAVLDQDGADVRGVCEALLPLDEARVREWRVWLGFWGRAVGDAALGAEQRQRQRDTLDTLATVVRAARPGTSAARARDEARRLLTVVTGLAAQAVFDPADWPPSRQRRMLQRELRR